MADADADGVPRGGRRVELRAVAAVEVLRGVERGESRIAEGCVAGDARDEAAVEDDLGRAAGDARDGVSVVSPALGQQVKGLILDAAVRVRGAAREKRL